MAQLRYSYERALNPTKSEIRLLSILPGPPSSDIECTIEIASLCHSLSYACLSYTWGEPGDVAVITLNSLPFTVTKSLLTALHHLRNDLDVVQIWVDAICINQKDNSEKASQVRQMSEIYMKSNKVVIWLGEEADDSSHAMKFIHAIDRRTVCRRFQQQKSYHTIPKYFDDRTLVAITKLLKRPWWCRTWIIQEATCANETLVRCGTDTTDFVAFVATANCLAHRTFGLSPQHRNGADVLPLQRVMALHQLKMERNLPGHHPDMLNLLTDFRTSQASDPRDKIFAFAALATGRHSATINPDYTIPVNVAYMRFAYAVIKSEKNLNILGFCQKDIQTVESWSSRPIDRDVIPSTPLPSWTPDWEIMIETTSFAKYELLVDSQSKRLYKATTSFEPLVRLIESTNTLNVRGCTFDRVFILAPGIAPSLISTTMQSWHEWVMAQYETTNMPPGLLHDAFLHTIAADSMRIEERWVRGFSAEWPLPRAVDDTEEAFDSASAMGLAVHNRQLFISEKGFLGLARFDVSSGDQICLLHGGQVPFVLREIGDAYHFGGECYVHGLMDGEGMNYPHVWKDFTLR